MKETKAEHLLFYYFSTII